MAGITPLNNFLGPESDPVTVATQLPKYQSTKDPSTFFGVFVTPQFVQALFTVYLLYELKVPGPFKDVQRKRPRPKTNASFQIPGGQNAVRAPAAGMRSGRGVDWR